MNSPIVIAKQYILNPSGITEHYLQKLLEETMTLGIDYADIYLQYSEHESWHLEEGIVKKANYRIDQGIGVRAVSGEKSGYSYGDELSLPILNESLQFAKNIASSGKSGSLKVLQHKYGHKLYKPENPLISLDDNFKVNFLKEMDMVARNCDPRVNQVMVSLTGAFKTILIATSDGVITADVRPMVSCGVSVVVESNGKREHGACRGGARGNYNFFLDNERGYNYAREAVRIALVNLEATPAPAGTMPVVLGSGWPAVMLHEAVGHGLESDHHRKKSSIYTGKIGEKVASDLCTVIDQGNLGVAKRGSLNIDDEGTVTQATTLIENGILCGLMHDKFNARLMHTKSTGNGRRSSYANIPIPRMTNTFFLAGNSDPQEIIESVDKGIYAVNFIGGQVDITSGEFVFSTSEAYLIEKGKVTRPVKNATLIGNGPEVLNKITMMGNDLAFDEGVGVCGKDGQSVAVGVGQPTLKISELTVGGTEKNN